MRSSDCTADALMRARAETLHFRAADILSKLSAISEKAALKTKQLKNEAKVAEVQDAYFIYYLGQLDQWLMNEEAFALNDTYITISEKYVSEYQDYINVFFKNMSRGIHPKFNVTRLKELLDYGISRSEKMLRKLLSQPEFFLNKCREKQLKKISLHYIYIIALNCFRHSSLEYSYRGIAGWINIAKLYVELFLKLEKKHTSAHKMIAVISQDFKSGKTYQEKGLNYSKNYQFAEAGACFFHALVRGDKEALLGAASVLQEKGDFVGAKQFINQAMDYFPPTEEDDALFSYAERLEDAIILQQQFKKSLACQIEDAGKRVVFVDLDGCMFDNFNYKKDKQYNCIFPTPFYYSGSVKEWHEIFSNFIKNNFLIVICTARTEGKSKNCPLFLHLIEEFQGLIYGVIFTGGSSKYPSMIKTCNELGIPATRFAECILIDDSSEHTMQAHAAGFRVVNAQNIPRYRERFAAFKNYLFSVLNAITAKDNRYSLGFFDKRQERASLIATMTELRP